MSQELSHVPAAGIVLLDSVMRPVYGNAEAIRILAYPESPEKIPSAINFLSEKIRTILPGTQTLRRVPVTTEVQSGKRRYLCRFFVLGDHPTGFAPSPVVVVIERGGFTATRLAKIAEEYHLTVREREAAECLIRGLTNKEVAQRMKVSPNTVKVYLRLLMAKLGTSTRSAIVGKILQP